VESSRQAMPRSSRNCRTSERSISISGRTMPSDVDGPNAGQAGGPGAAQETKEDGFGLIGASVAGGHAIDRSAGDGFAEEGQPGLARGLLQVVGRLGDGGLAQRERQAQPIRQTTHEFGVLAGFLAAQAVVQVQNAQMEVPTRSEFEERAEQAHGIGPARDGDTHLLGRFEHAVAGDGVGDAIKHGEYRS
jgi:hypothetical protein